jgi:hypothetical protein
MGNAMSDRLKVWLDDEPQSPMRAALCPAPEWTHTRWPEETIELLKTGRVEHLSLDHDLGECHTHSKPRTGYDVLLWIEEQVKVHGFVPPRIRIHSQNASARDKMKAACRQIHAYHQENLQKAQTSGEQAPKMGDVEQH